MSATYSKTVGFDAKNDDKNTGEQMLASLKKTFRPEFLNRVDEIIVFHPLSQEHTRKIVELMMANVTKRLEERDIHLAMSSDALDLLAHEGFDSEYGARPLRRAISQKVEDSLAEGILRGEYKLGDKVEGVVEEGKLVFHKQKRTRAKAAVKAESK